MGYQLSKEALKKAGPVVLRDMKKTEKVTTVNPISTGIKSAGHA